MGRAPCCDKANVKRGPWSPEEDAKLKAFIETHGTGGNWIALPQKIGLKRCGKSCRLRWLNYLRPNIKHGGFTEEEDNIICNLYISIGSRWSIIAAQLPGRTDNDIKNYWNTRLKKKLLGKRKQSNFQPRNTNGLMEENSYPNALSSSALERLQLHMQLQGLQNPFSNFYNNPALWPKLHPSQEKMVQTLQSFKESSNPLMQNTLLSTHAEQGSPKAEAYKPATAADVVHQDAVKINSSKVDLLENSLNGMSSMDTSVPFMGTENKNPLDSNLAPRGEGVEQSNMGIQEVSALQAELDDILNNRTTCYIPQEDQMAEFDCFREINGSKESLMWWSNDFDGKSASSNSWDSTATPVLQTDPGMFQDYELGYSQ
ncbi:hypothetical protein L6164_014089 [Bauhinia variegata]|uniref:Uncharacterized protein n=1 Tax=Bauhinia variegata TaxID=167791 RepID=A0ACB9NH51_BAUVA|nr:hypothetical protein L6164_014089 [Bauhinia variegata]